jgi:NADPH-dependent curcumin reductase CurA
VKAGIILLFKSFLVVHIFYKQKECVCKSVAADSLKEHKIFARLIVTGFITFYLPERCRQHQLIIMWLCRRHEVRTAKGIALKAQDH